MRKLIYGFNVSLDGFIEDANGNFDWSMPDPELHRVREDDPVEGLGRGRARLHQRELVGDRVLVLEGDGVEPGHLRQAALHQADVVEHQAVHVEPVGAEQAGATPCSARVGGPPRDAGDTSGVAPGALRSKLKVYLGNHGGAHAEKK